MSVETPPGIERAGLVAVDMDGTLLDESGRIPAALWPLLDRLDARGIRFVPASGRQYATLASMFRGRALTCICENGALVRRGDEVISTAPLDIGFVHEAIARVRELAAAGHDIGAVRCCARTAYVERGDEPFLEAVRRYYRSLEVVDDIDAIDEETLKVAVHDAADAETDLAPLLAPLGRSHRVVVSGGHWIDLMGRDVDKGVALRALQRTTGIGPDRTIAFGDFHNDLGMLEAADYSYAMANAHPDIIAAARHLAPSNRDHGVVQVLERVVEG